MRNKGSENRVRIKICGLSRPEDIQTANELDLDYIGFIFAKKGHRYVTEEQAAELSALLRKDIQAVGVFVNAPCEQVAELLRKQVIQIAQLHGNEDEDYISRLRTMTDQPIWKAFRIENKDDVCKAEQSSADCILLDHGMGGTGESFDWSLLDHIQRPYILAGGLDETNADEALTKPGLYGVDVSSGVETDRKKDPEKMKAFVRQIRDREAEK